jgi:hypothetical protein
MLGCMLRMLFIDLPRIANVITHESGKGGDNF